VAIEIAQILSKPVQPISL